MNNVEGINFAQRNIFNKIFDVKSMAQAVGVHLRVGINELVVIEGARGIKAAVGPADTLDCIREVRGRVYVNKGNGRFFTVNWPEAGRSVDAHYEYGM